MTSVTGAEEQTGNMLNHTEPHWPGKKYRA